MKKLYSDKTAQLIKRMEKVALREEFVFDKRKIRKSLEKAYQLYKLPMPEIVWCKDIIDERFSRAVSAASAASAARAASAASAARAAWAASAVSAARAVSAAWAAWAASAVSAAWAASAVSAARAASAAWAARAAAADYDQDNYVYICEFLQTNEGNENDHLAVKGYELFLQAKEAGMGYFAEQNGILYVCPIPIIRLENLRYHSETKPAIEWEQGLQLYYLHGVYLEKDLWKKILAKKLTFKQCMELRNIEQRMMALKYLGAENLLEEANAELLDKVRGYELYKITSIFPRPQYFLKYTCPSTARVYVSGIDPVIGSKNDAIKALKWKFYLEDEETSSKIFDLES